MKISEKSEKTLNLEFQSNSLGRILARGTPFSAYWFCVHRFTSHMH